MPQGHATLERQSSQSALSSDSYRIRQGGFSLLQAHQKNSGTSFCVQYPLDAGIMIIEHKTTAFQVW